MSEPYSLSRIDYTEEGLQSDIAPGVNHKGWRRFRIGYRNEMGFSNIEGIVYIPPGIEDPYPILDQLVEKLNVAINR